MQRVENKLARASRSYLYMNKVIFKVDDFLSDEFHLNNGSNVDLNCGRFFGTISKYPQVKISLGVIGRTLKGAPSNAIGLVKAWIDSGKIEIFNHSFAHSEEPATVQDAIYNQDVIDEYFNVRPNIYGAPRNDVSVVGKWDRTMYGKDIPINAYRELENVIPGSFVTLDNFQKKYEKNHSQVKVYQMHPWVWTRTDFEEFEMCLKIMLDDNKQWIFPSELS
jgi:hypothetical protein